MVGYRWFAKQHADLLGITGYVRNKSRGEVEILAQGEETDVLTYIDFLKQGPSRAKVTKIVREEVEPERTYQQFSIRM